MEGEETKKGVKQNVVPSHIKNKIKRSLIYHKIQAKKKVDKKKKREKRKRDEEKLGEEAPPKQVPRTIENTREFDETVVAPDDQEVLEDEKTDQMSEYFQGKQPYILVTTSIRPSSECLSFVDELISVFPNSHYYKRRTFDLKKNH